MTPSENMTQTEVLSELRQREGKEVTVEDLGHLFSAYTLNRLKPEWKTQASLSDRVWKALWEVLNQLPYAERLQVFRHIFWSDPKTDQELYEVIVRRLVAPYSRATMLARQLNSMKQRIETVELNTLESHRKIGRRPKEPRPPIVPPQYIVPYECWVAVVMLAIFESTLKEAPT